MAAPKQWGYSRDQPVGNEMLVSWADGDLIEILTKEVVERLLTHPEERAQVAAFARACEDTVDPHDGHDRIERPRSGLTELCVSMAEPMALLPGEIAMNEGSVRSRALTMPAIAFGTMARAGVVLGLTAVVLLWMLRNL